MHLQADDGPETHELNERTFTLFKDTSLIEKNHIRLLNPLSQYQTTVNLLHVKI